MDEKRWIPETLFDELGFRMTFAVDKVLYELQTEHQHLILFEQPYFGKMLMLDGATQISKRDEFIYQEMMSHVPLFAHGHARDVLIIGGGPAGLCAAMYAGRGMLDAVLLERGVTGGELLNTEKIEDYPGFVSILGRELADRMTEHAEKFGARVLFDDVTDRRSLSRELENTKKFLELVVDNIPVSLVVARVSDGRGARRARR